MERCFLCKVSPDVSLLHFSICWRKPKFLGCLLQSGWEASSVRPSSGLTPLQDAVATFHHGIGPVAEDCSRGECLEMLRELVAAPSVDFTVCLEEGGKQRLALELVLQGSNSKHCKATICKPARKFLMQQLKMINQKEKVTDKKKNNQTAAKESSRLEETCWKCLKSSDIEQLFQCADCMEAWYCGLVCQRGDWEKHWQRCQKMRKKKRKQKDEEKENGAAFATGSLASALD